MLGALTDNLVPDMVEEEDAEELGKQNFLFIEIVFTILVPYVILLLV